MLVTVHSAELLEVWVFGDFQSPRLSPGEQPIQRVEGSHLVPPNASELCLSAYATIAALTGIDEKLFSISVQTEAAEDASNTGKHYGGLALLLDSDDRSQVANARAVASNFAAVLGKPPTVQMEYAHTDAAELGEHDSRPPMLRSVDDLVSASFLGARIQVPLELVVPGYVGCQLLGRFRRSKGRSFSSRQVTVRGHLRWIKVGGKTNRVFVNATDVETKQSFGNHPILFDNKFRDSLAQSLANPSALLQLVLVVQQLDDGRSRPRIKYVVESVDLA